MEKLNFKEILLHTAVCAIACDGDIDDREKEALYNIEKKSPYFSTEDLSSTLDELIDNCMSGFQSFKDELFKSLNEVELNIVEELTLLEVSFRIIAADDIEQESEQEFIINLRKHLKLENDIIKERFGMIDYLTKEESEFKSFDIVPDIEIREIKSNKK
jgi:hypothetical protein